MTPDSCLKHYEPGLVWGSNNSTLDTGDLILGITCIRLHVRVQLHTSMTMKSPIVNTSANPLQQIHWSKSTGANPLKMKVH